MEQIDYGIGYKGRNSPQAHSSAHSDGGGTAMNIIALMLATIAVTVSIGTCFFVKGSIESSTSATERRLNDKVVASETRSMDYAYLAKQEARIALEKGQQVENQLKGNRK